MKVGIKYCGGCNPAYDRSEIVNRLKSEFAGQLTFEAVDIDQTYDVILVVAGCRSCCADYAKLRSKNGLVFIVSDGDYLKACDLLKKLVRQQIRETEVVK